MGVTFENNSSARLFYLHRFFESGIIMGNAKHAKGTWKTRKARKGDGINV